MSHYIVCQKKRNNPRMDVRICAKKCELKNECAGYKTYVKETSLKDDSQTMELKAA